LAPFRNSSSVAHGILLLIVPNTYIFHKLGVGQGYKLIEGIVGVHFASLYKV